MCMTTRERSAATTVKCPTTLGIWCVVFVAFVSSTSAEPPAHAPGLDDRAASAGHWAVVSVEWEGKPVDPEFLAMLRVDYQADGSWSVLFKKLPVAQGTSKSHQDQSPKTFEMATLGSEGIQPSRYVGIYRLDGDTRVLCIVREGKPRPDAFAAPSRSGRMLVTLKRLSGA